MRGKAEGKRRDSGYRVAVPPASSASRTDRAPRLLATVFLFVCVVAVRGRIAPLPCERTENPAACVEVLSPAPAISAVSLRIWTEEGARKPVQGARVRLFWLPTPASVWESISEANSEIDGGARLPVPERARGHEVWLVIDAPGFARASLARVLPVDAAVNDAPMDVHLVPEHRLAVTVVDDEGRPVPNARVFLEGRGALCPSWSHADERDTPEGDRAPAPAGGACRLPVPVGAKTVASGVAQLVGIPNEKSVVVADAPGFDVTRTAPMTMAGATTIVVKKLAGFLVTVLGPDGKPVRSASIFVDGASLGPTRTATSGADGRVRIAGLPAGLFTLRAQFGEMVSQVNMAEELRKGEERALTLQLVPGRMAMVTVRDGEEDDAPPLAGAHVTLAEGGLSPFPIVGTTGKDGTVRLGPFLGASASITAEALGRVPSYAESLPESGVLTLHLAVAAELTTRVMDSRGRPVSGAKLTVVGFDSRGMPFAADPSRDRYRAAQFAADGASRPFVSVGELGVVPGPVKSFRDVLDGTINVQSALSQWVGASAPTATSVENWITGGDGRVTSAHVPPGRLRVVVTHPEYVPTLSEPIELKSGENREIEVTVLQGGAIEGVVSDERGHPIADAEVTLQSKDGSQERMATTGSDGSFVFAAVGAAAYLSVALSEEGYAVALREEISVPDGGRKRVTLTVPSAREPLAIRVVDDRGYPLDSAEIVLLSLDPKVPLRRTVFTDKRGEAVARGFGGLPARAQVFAQGHAPRTETLEGKKDIRFALGVEESATVIVRDRRAQRVQGATVFLLTETGQKQTTTDAEGEATLSGLAPGKATLRVQAEGFSPRSISVRVEAQRGMRPTAFPPVELQEGAEVVGVVKDVQGAPVAGARVAVGTVPVFLPSGPLEGVAITDRRGEFRLRDVTPGPVVLEAYAADKGRGRSSEFSVARGQTTRDVVIKLQKEAGASAAEFAGGGVAVTLGETNDDSVVVVAVARGSEAERAGVAAGDEIEAVDGAPVETMADARKRLAGPVGVDAVVRITREGAAVTLRIPREPLRK